MRFNGARIQQHSAEPGQGRSALGAGFWSGSRRGGASGSPGKDRRQAPKSAEAGGYSTEEIEEQMEVFAADVMPVLRRECGGGPMLPESGGHVVPERLLAGVTGS